MAYAPSNKYRLMSPQWLGIQERKQGVPKDRCSQCKIDDEEAALLFDNIKRRVTVKHDPKMIVPVLRENPSINKYQSFPTSFFSIMQNEPEFQYMPEDCIESPAYKDEYEGVCLRSIDV